VWGPSPAASFVLLEEVAMRNREVLVRQFRLVVLLHQKPRGLSAVELAAQLGASRATVQRDVELLKKRVGFPITRKRSGQNVRYQLKTLPLSVMSATPREVAALMFAREALTPLDGTKLMESLDSVLASLPRERAKPGIETVTSETRTADVVRTIDAALESKTRVRLTYRVVTRGGAISEYEAEPIALRFVDGLLYLFAWIPEKKADRTFKVARIVSAEPLTTRSKPPASLNSERAFKKAVKAWSGQEALPSR
jgi:predicted DNA-binding transcriptional regulator YafY